jgi:hypothetical protein
MNINEKFDKWVVSMNEKAGTPFRKAADIEAETPITNKFRYPDERPDVPRLPNGKPDYAATLRKTLGMVEAELKINEEELGFYESGQKKIVNYLIDAKLADMLKEMATDKKCSVSALVEQIIATSTLEQLKKKIYNIDDKEHLETVIEKPKLSLDELGRYDAVEAREEDWKKQESPLSTAMRWKPTLTNKQETTAEVLARFRDEHKKKYPLKDDAFLDKYQEMVKAVDEVSAIHLTAGDLRLFNSLPVYGRDQITQEDSDKLEALINKILVKLG